MDTLILGIGNLLLGDEGVGVHVARRILDGEPLPAGVECLDGGTGSLVLLEPMQAARRMILVDATADGQAPGTVTRLVPRFSKDFPPSLAAHDIGLRDLLDSFYLSGSAPQVTLYAVSISLPQDMTTELSAPVAAVVPEVTRRVREEVMAAERTGD